MSASLETGQNNTQKRVRIHTNMNSTTDKSQATKVKTPKALALACVQGTAASLHPQVQKIVENYGNQLIDLHHKLQQKNTQLSKMEKNNDFIPRSARINFEFYVRPTVEQSPEFTSIQSETTDLIKSFQLNLKSQIMKSMRLDISHLKNEIKTVVCSLIYYTAKAFHLQHNPTVVNHPVVHTITFLINGFGDNLLKHCDLDKNSFKTRFAEIFHDTTIHNLQSFTSAAPSNAVNNANHPRNPYARNLTQLSQMPTSQETNTNTRIPVDITSATTFIDFLRQTLEGILVTSIDNYNTQVNTNNVNSQLEAFSTEVLHEQATERTVDQMDISPSVSPTELQELIAKSTSKAVDSLSREIQSLKSKLTQANSSQKRQKSKNSSSQPAKNSSQRGRTSASLKKKNPSPNTSRSKSPATNSKRGRSRSAKPTGRKHASKNRDSSKDKKNKSNKTNKSRSKGKRQNSHANSKQD